MRSRIPAVLIALAASGVAALAQPPMPRLERRGAVTQLIVDGKPWLSLGGELLNNAASTAENARPVWPDLARMHLNTVLVGVGWGWTEPQPGKFDFSALDGVLRDARTHRLRVVLLWFGSWKNGTSSYAPAWVRRDWQKYPIARDAQGRGREILSPLSDVNRDADARAYAALLRHVREVDAATRTVIMIQLENEVGLLGDSRDRSPEADAAFAAPVKQTFFGNASQLVAFRLMPLEAQFRKKLQAHWSSQVTDMRRRIVAFQDRSEGRITSWKWEFGDGATSTEQHPTHEYQQGGDYTVTLTVEGPDGMSRLAKVWQVFLK